MRDCFSFVICQDSSNVPGRNYFKNKLLILVLFLTIFSSDLFAQKTITGTVSVGDSVLRGASVSVKGTNITTQSDNEGKYTLSASPAGTLVFSFVGYKSQEIKINNRSIVNIQLTSATQQLGDVVVDGYGTQKRKDLTGSIVTLNDNAVKNRPVANLNEATLGQVAGVNVALNDGSPGGTNTIRIRGVGSISAGNEPLYVIDGFPTTQVFANSILPSNIESINVLKDASATAIYGSRGSNGVILITTKSGKNGKPILNVNLSSGIALGGSYDETLK